jgi:hypothetical protein
MQPTMGPIIFDFFYYYNSICLIMNILPKLKKCPACNSINLIRINGLTYENKFQSLSEWTFKKKINCRKCKIELGLFLHKNMPIEKLIWLNILECEENQFKKLNKLEKNKIKYKEKNMNKEHKKVIQEIQIIQNKIRLEQAKVKIKVKMQNIGLLN